MGLTQSSNSNETINNESLFTSYENDTEEFEYNGWYRIKGNGLVTIKSEQIDKYNDLYPYKLLQEFDCSFKLIIQRHKQNYVDVHAIIKKEIADVIDDSNPNQIKWHELHYPNSGFSGILKGDDYQWVPWNDDAIYKNNDEFKKKRCPMLRGENRLNLLLTVPGVYTVTIPEDADLNVKLNNGNIDYNSASPTFLKIKSKTVNKYGQDGYHCNNLNVWNYFRGSPDRHPVTNLSAKNNHINV